jgi:hypothetical protein
MLDPESEQIREVYAFFGLAIYNAQSLEREPAMVLAASGTNERFTAWDYDDTLAGNFDSTFGALVTKFSELADPQIKPLLPDLERAVELRNELVHRYFWNRALQFSSNDGRAQMLEELKQISNDFDGLDAKLSTWTHRFMSSKGVGTDVLQKEFAELLSGTKLPHDPKQIRKKVYVTGACEWKVGDSVECAIVFSSDAGNLIGKTGLCLGPQGIPLENLYPKPEFINALPATVDAKPKKAGAWNYVIPLANGHELRARPDEVAGKKVVRFGLKRDVPSGSQRHGKNQT